MRALACGVLTRKGAPDAPKSKDKGKGKSKDQKKGKGKAVEEDMEMQNQRLILGDAKGADVAELAALEAAWAGYMRRMAEADEDEDEDKEDAAEVTLRDGIARCREREYRHGATKGISADSPVQSMPVASRVCDWNAI